MAAGLISMMAEMNAQYEKNKDYYIFHWSFVCLGVVLVYAVLGHWKNTPIMQSSTILM